MPKPKTPAPRYSATHGTWQQRVIRHTCKAWASSRETEEGANHEIVEWYNAGPNHPNLHGSVGLTGSLPDLAETVERLQRVMDRTQREPNLVRECLCDQIAERRKSK